MSLSINKMAICENAPIIDMQNDAIIFNFKPEDYNGTLDEFLKVVDFAIKNGKYVVLS